MIIVEKHVELAFHLLLSVVQMWFGIYVHWFRIQTQPISMESNVIDYVKTTQMADLIYEIYKLLQGALTFD